MNVVDLAVAFSDSAGVGVLEGVDCADVGAVTGFGVTAGVSATTGAGARVVGLGPPMFRVIVGGGLGASCCSGRSIGGGSGWAG